MPKQKLAHFMGPLEILETVTGELHVGPQAWLPAAAATWAAPSPAPMYPPSCLKKTAKAAGPQPSPELYAGGGERPLPTLGHTSSPGSYESQRVPRIWQIIPSVWFLVTKPRGQGQVEDRTINPCVLTPPATKSKPHAYGWVQTYGGGIMTFAVSGF